MSKPRKVAVVVNPHSAGGRTAREWPELASLLENRLGPVHTRFTDDHGAGIAITQELLREGHDLIIAVGGDGTINEVANGFFDRNDMINPEAALGVLPLGTGGDFRRTLGIPTRPSDAIDVLASGPATPIDVGFATFRARNGQPTSRYFVNLVSFGMGGHVAAQSKNFMRKFGGRAAFFWATVKTFLSYRGRDVHLTLDEGAHALSCFITNVAIGNGQFHGGGMWPCPAAAPNDGVFDVTIIDYAGALRLLASISVLYSGKVYSHPLVRHFEAGRILAESSSTTEIEIDGEPLGTLPLEISILPRRLRVHVPPSCAWLAASASVKTGTTAHKKNSLGCFCNPG